MTAPSAKIMLEGFFISFRNPLGDRIAVIYACTMGESFPWIRGSLLEIVSEWSEKLAQRLG